MAIVRSPYSAPLCPTSLAPVPRRKRGAAQRSLRLAAKLPLTSVPVPFSSGPCRNGGPTVAEELRRDVRFALGWKVGKKLRPLTDTERDMVADAIVEHIRLCNWKVERGPPWGGFSYLAGAGETK